MEGRIATTTLGRDHGSDTVERDLLANGVGVIATIGEQRLGLIGDHPEQRAEALHIVGFARRQDEAERTAFSVTGGVEFRGEPAARSAKRLGRLSPSHDVSPVNGIILHFAVRPDVAGIQLSQVTSTGGYAAPVQPHIRSPLEAAAP